MSQSETLSVDHKHTKSTCRWVRYKIWEETASGVVLGYMDVTGLSVTSKLMGRMLLPVAGMWTPYLLRATGVHIPDNASQSAQHFLQSSYQQTDRQQTHHETSIAIGHIYDMYAMWPSNEPLCKRNTCRHTVVVAVWTVLPVMY